MIRRVQATREKAIGVARSFGLLGGRVALPDSAVIVSPHLDDAVFSLGAAIARATRTGRTVTVLTVLAGDPENDAPAGPWDAAAGFATAGEAARRRREEDTRACDVLGAVAEWLPLLDHQYEPRPSADELRAAVFAAVGERPVLLPGFPLRHEDHELVHRALADAFPHASIYAEQPYSAAHSDRPGVSAEPTAAGAPGPAAWRYLRADVRDRRHKLQACRAYATQLALLGPKMVREILTYELRVGGEAIVP
jgi:LmbE family N-acetylglucosaminyl deacetylase